MPTNADVGQLYQELLKLFEAAQQLQAQSTQLLDVARQTRVSVLAVSDAPVPDDAPTPPVAGVPLSPEQTLDAMITLLADFSLETQMAITKALALGMATTARARLSVKHPPVA